MVITAKPEGITGRGIPETGEGRREPSNVVCVSGHTAEQPEGPQAQGLLCRRSHLPEPGCPQALISLAAAAKALIVPQAKP